MARSVHVGEIVGGELVGPGGARQRGCFSVTGAVGELFFYFALF
jgi:hypothetical protein